MKAWAFFLLSLLIVAAATLLNGEASADTEIDCRPEYVSYNRELITFVCSGLGTLHQVFGPPYGGQRCVGETVSLDTLKILISMLQSSLLSGRPVDVLYNPPTGGTACPNPRTVTGVVLKNK